MERESPIKSWMQRHSPIKSRNKPLPRPPQQTVASPIKRPISRISESAAVPAPEQQAKPKRRLVSFFRANDKPATSTEVPVTSRGHHRYNSVPAEESTRPPASPNLKNLSAKVNSLEEQLKEARKQLDIYASVSRRTKQQGLNGPDSSVQPIRGDPAPKLEGVMESLLLQQQQQQQKRRHEHRRPAQQPQGHKNRDNGQATLRPASADMSEAFDHYRRALDAYEDAKNERTYAHVSDGEDDLYSPARLKRRRSEVRSSSWQAVQDYTANEAQSRRSKNSAYALAGVGKTSWRTASDGQKHRPSQTDYQNKSLPKCPPKSPSPTPKKKEERSQPTRHQRSSSKTENELAGEDAAAAAKNQSSSENKGRSLSPSKRYASSPLKLLPVAEEFEWDDEVF